ncbi:MAG TPA: SAM-dependent chlorinase/fluorinase [Thermoanaerobaculia bacterium]|nr:SAM-dependent chlorinase/fluorinase [Thermoanaerobaculia bacterium]
MALLTLLTDFGLADYYVAAVKGTVLRLAPGSQVIDISHEVGAGDIRAAAFLLAAAVPSFPAGTVHLAVVDPGVGSRRRILVAQSGGAMLVAPDNGLLTPWLDGSGRGGASGRPHLRAVERADLFLAGPSRTFDGRDRFAPVAAYLLRGEPAAGLGPEIGDPVLLAGPPPRREPGLLAGTVAHIDRFGNLVTDIPAAWLPAALPAGPRLPGLEAVVGGHSISHLVTHYDEIPPEEAALLAGSLGTLELSARGTALASLWKIKRGEPVCVRWRPQENAPATPRES